MGMDSDTPVSPTQVFIPPGPTKGEIVLHLPSLLGNFMGALQKCVEQYGDVVLLPFKPPTYFINHPEDIKHILVTNNKNYRKTRAFKIGRKVFGNGLLTSDEPLHTQQRRILQPIFQRQHVSVFGQLMIETVIGQMDSRWKSGKIIDVASEMTRMTISIVTKALFGMDISHEAPQLQKALTICQRHIERQNRLGFGIPEHWPTPGNRRYDRSVALFDHVMDRIIQAKKLDHAGTRDLLTMLLESTHGNGSTMTDKQIRDEIVTFLLAGHETTANALSWTWYLLATHPEAEERLSNELRSVLGGNLPDATHLPLLKYTGMVFAESLRLYPPVWRLGRTAIDGDSLPSGVHIPARSEIVIHTFIAHRNPRYFPEPDRFDPERFSDENVKRRPPFTYFPFGGGSRICIGEDFAKMEGTLLIAAISQQYTLRLVPGQKVRPEPLITLRPKRGIKMKLERR